MGGTPPQAPSSSSGNDNNIQRPLVDDTQSGLTHTTTLSNLPAGCHFAETEDADAETDTDKPSSESNPPAKPLDTSKIIVSEPPNDPLNPQNWPRAAKAQTLGVLILLVISQAWAGSAEATSNTSLRQNFNVSAMVADAEISTYLFGIGVGALFAGPLSSSYGRNVTYMLASVGYLLFILGTCLIYESFAGLLVCRFFAGLFSSAVLGINGATAKDVLGEKEREWVFPLIAWANVVGPVLSPIVGGTIDHNYSPPWKWTQWTTLIVGGFTFIIALLFLPETHYPMLLEWRATQLRKHTKDQRYTSEWASSAGFLQLAKETIPKPITLFATDLVIAVFGSYLILLYILLFTFLSGFEFLFKDPYGLDDWRLGACFGSIVVGGTIYVFLDPAVRFVMRRRKRRGSEENNAETGKKEEAKKEQGSSGSSPSDDDNEQGKEQQEGDESTPPERLLWPSILAAPLLPISLFWLGWTSRASISIWSPLAACVVFGIVITAMYTSIYEYIIASYGEKASVALASITMARYIIAGGMVMAARAMYEAMGTGFVMTLLGGVAFVLTPAPWLIWRYGDIVRKKSKFAQG